MKRLIVLLFILFLCIGSFADADYLKWDAVTSPTPDAPVLGYVVYYQDIATQETYNKDVGNVVQYTLPGDLNLENGKQYRFYVIVYNKDGESAPSNAAEWTVPIYVPPVDKLPDIVINVPDSSSVNITIVNE